MSETAPTTSPEGDQVFALIAEYPDTGSILKAAEKVRDAGYRNWDVITPFPVHGMDAAMGLKRSLVPLIAFGGGITGFLGAYLMIWYMNSYDYPLIVGGKPYFSPVFSFPVAYELTILLAAFGAIGGMFLLNRLPMHHHPTLNYAQIERASNDRFFIVIESTDPLYAEDKTPSFLEEIGGSNIDRLHD